MNRSTLEQSALEAGSRCMDKRSYISLVEVFLEMGKLTR